MPLLKFQPLLFTVFKFRHFKHVDLKYLYLNSSLNRSELTGTEPLTQHAAMKLYCFIKGNINI